MKNFTILIITVLALCCGTTAQAQQLAFPGADGYGKNATGGRGGEVCYVTRLDDCTDANLVPGTLRWAIRHDNGGKPRTILFATSGTIYLTSKLKFQYPDVSILGQSAPGGGVTITGFNMYICKNNVIIRYLRFRAGDIPNTSMTGLDMENAQNVILDHCSMTWSMEECLTAYDTKNTTVQWCIIGEGLYSSKNSKGARAYATQWGGEHSTMHHTLITNSHSRSPRFNGVRSPSNSKGEHDYQVDSEFANNVVFNWSGSGAIYGGEYDKTKVEVAAWTKNDPGYNRVYMINNYYRPGPSSKTGKAGAYFASPSSPYGQWYAKGNKFEVSGAYAPWTAPAAQAANDDNSKGLRSLTSSYIMTEIPYTLSGMSYESADEAYQKVVAQAGASLPRYDEVDRRLLDEAAGTVSPRFHGNTIPDLGIIDSPSDVTLSYPDTYIVNGETQHDMPKMFFEGQDKYFVDSDADGMPDGYEDTKGFNKKDPADGAAVASNGYTNLENYLNAIADGTISPTAYCTSATYVEPGPQEEAPENVTYTFSKGTASGVVGEAPKAITAKYGTEITIPVNRTLYREGYTLTHWSTGVGTVSPGDKFSNKKDVTLTPSFTANKISLADRTQDVTITWDFTDAAAPASLSGTGIYVAQANFGGAEHDVKLSYSNGTLTIPACATAKYEIVGTTTVSGTATGDQLVVDAPAGLKTVTITLPYIWNTPGRVYHTPQLGDGSDHELFYTTKETVLASDWINASYLDYAQERTFYTPAKDDDSSMSTHLCVMFNGSDRTYDMFVKDTKKIKVFLCHSNSNADQCYLYAYPSDGGDALMVKTATISQKQQPANLVMELDKSKSYRIQLVSRDDYDWAIAAVKLYGEEPELPSSGSVTAMWPWEGTFTENATVSTKSVLKSATATLGTKVELNGEASNMKILPQEKMLKVQAYNSTQNIDEEAVVTFTLTPNTGISFLPERLAFNAVCCGTNSINYTVTVQQGNGTEKVVIDGKHPNRDNDDPAASPFRPDDIDLKAYGFTSSSEATKVRVKIYNVFHNEGVPKDLALNKITVTGTYTGKAPEVKKYTFNAVASPSAAASVIWTPAGSTMEEGTTVTVEAQSKSGYYFQNWTDQNGNVFATTPQATYKITENTVLTANYKSASDYAYIFQDCAPYDAAVTSADELQVALTAAGSRSDKEQRYRIFLHNGTYDLGKKAKTAVVQNTSLIGESMDGVIILNNPGAVASNYQENTPVLFIDQNQNNVYMQDLTIRQARDWDAKKSAGQAVALRQRGKQAAYKNVRMQGIQDTYYLNKADATAYFEDCDIAGEVDFIYGDGTMFFQNCVLHPVSSGACITASNAQTGYKGIVFNDCTIDAEPTAKSSVAGYALGRPWGDSPAVTYLNTTMKVLPMDAGWRGMSNGLVVRFHEYGSKDAEGNAINLSQRNISACNAAASSDACVIDATMAAAYSLDKVFPSWQPQSATAQIAAPTVSLSGSTLSWNAVSGAYAYAVCKDGSVIGFTTSTTYSVSGSGTFTVRSANQMGGLGEQSKPATTGIDSVVSSTVSDAPKYNLSGQRISTPHCGQVYLQNGTKRIAR